MGTHRAGHEGVFVLHLPQLDMVPVGWWDGTDAAAALENLAFAVDREGTADRADAGFGVMVPSRSRPSCRPRQPPSQEVRRVRVPSSSTVSLVAAVRTRCVAAALDRDEPGACGCARRGAIEVIVGAGEQAFSADVGGCLVLAGSEPARLRRVVGAVRPDTLIQVLGDLHQRVVHRYGGDQRPRLCLVDVRAIGAVHRHVVP